MIEATLDLGSNHLGRSKGKKIPSRLGRHELKIDGIKGNMDGLKGDINGIKGNIYVFKVDMDAMNVKLEGLTKLLQKNLLVGDKVIHENHDEDKRNMNYDFRDSNVGFKKNHIPKIDMRKFYRKDLVTWIL